MKPQNPAIRVDGLRKSYEKLDVLKGADFTVAARQLFALLGSNSAGKTTVVRILSTLLKPDGGTATVGESERRVPGRPGTRIDQPDRAVRGRRRDPHRAREPGHGR